MFSRIFKVKKRKPYKKTIRPAKSTAWKVHKPFALDRVNQIIAQLNMPAGFEYNKISIRNQRTRWGSCSSNKNLNFNYKIIYLPDDLAEYLVVHELCHLKELNHSKKYWALVESFLPEYKDLSVRLRKFDTKQTIDY